MLLNQLLILKFKQNFIKNHQTLLKLKINSKLYLIYFQLLLIFPL
jgi:hypothetical protein